MPRLEAQGLDLAPRHLEILRSLLARHAPGCQAWAYGSRVTGGAHEGSDLDLVLIDPANPDWEPRGLSALIEALRDSALPMLVDVHAWASLPETFRRNVLAAYVVVG